MAIQRLAVFCGSRAGTRPAYAAAARAVGRTLAERGIGLVYGGGHVGLMGEAADAAPGAGGEVMGVIPHALAARDVAHLGLTELRKVDTMHERKALMAEMSGGFIALPGGLGTMEELFEVWTWAQLGIHRKPIGLLNVAGFYDGLLRFLDRAVGEGFVSETHRALLAAADDPASLVERMATLTPPEVSDGSRRTDDNFNLM